MTGIAVPPALNPIIGSEILLSHSFLSFSASLNFFVYFKGRALIILFFKNALTSLSDSISIFGFIIITLYIILISLEE